MELSVIIPVYNAEKQLCRCLNSIQSQTFRDFEVLLVDDGSKDQSARICKEFARQDPRFIYLHKENGGASSARNFGLQHARGIYLCFCDADDYVSPSWLSDYVRYKDYDFVVQGLNCFTHETDSTYHTIGGKEIISHWDSPKQMIQYLYGQKNLGYLHCRMFKSEIITRHHLTFNEHYTFREDQIFILQYMQYVNKAIITAEANYFYVLPEDVKFKYQNYHSIYTCTMEMMHYFQQFGFTIHDPILQNEIEFALANIYYSHVYDKTLFAISHEEQSLLKSGITLQSIRHMRWKAKPVALLLMLHMPIRLLSCFKFSAYAERRLHNFRGAK